MNYANQYGYTDVNPFEVVRVISDKTIEIRAMKAERDPSFKPEFVPGGFSAVCLNDCQQKWIITSDDTAKVIRIRLGKKGWRRLQFNLTPEDDEQLARLGLAPRDFTAEPQRFHALQLADNAAKKFLEPARVEQVGGEARHAVPRRRRSRAG